MREAHEQESFWRGEFGDAYVERNDGPGLIAGDIALFVEALSRAERLTSLIEFGVNRGLNLIALRQILPDCRFAGVEINARAHATASALALGSIWAGSLLDYPITETFDLSLTKGVLIHLPPEALEAAYAKLYGASHRYVLLAEYYNPTPVEVRYRGHEGKLFKRDFAGEMLDLYPDLRLIDYGFRYHRDPMFPGGDASWFLLEKRTSRA